MPNKTATTEPSGNILISLKSGATITIRGYGNLGYPGISSLVNAFQNQVRSQDPKAFEQVIIPAGSAAGAAQSGVAVRLADVSAIAFVPDR